jgi:hypothetical protein
VSLNGSGVYVVNSAGQPVVNNTLITSAAFNAFTADVATAISTAMMKDGQQTVTANIPFGGFKLTGVGAATARTDAATIATVQDGTGVYVATVGGTADAITLSPSPAITAYAAGQVFWFKAASTNTAATTVAISGLATIAVQANGAACVGGEITANRWYRLHCDTTSTCQLQSVNPGPPFLDTDALVRGSADGSKLLRFEVDGFTTGNTRVVTIPDQNLTVPALGGTNAWTGTQNFSGATVNLGVASIATNDFRLSLTTTVPVTTSDVTAAGTLYCVPYVGNRIALYDGSVWNMRTSAEFSLALTATSGKPYDVFCYDNAGTPTLETLVWTNDTTRATALVYQNGVLVQSGAATRRYLGTFYASGANTTEDSLAKRYLFNYYHRVARAMSAVDTTDSWTYATATYRQARATTTNQLDFIVGVSEDHVHAMVYGTWATDQAAGNVKGTVAIGLDSTSVSSATLIMASLNAIGNTLHLTSASYVGLPGVGRHILVWLEQSTTVGTTTWYGDAGGFTTQSGIMGEVWA